MNLQLICNKCIEEFGMRVLMNGIPFRKTEMNNEGIYEITCEHGHEIVVMVQQLKCELLFDMGALALIDGHNREAVSSFAASLERFYEFCIKVMVFDEDESGRIDDFNKTWKLVSNQSERQLGAFYFLYFNTFKEAPEGIRQKQIEFRNNVIHKGYIPKYDEVIKYAEYLYDYMYCILKKLRSKCDNGIHRVYMYEASNKVNGYISNGEITKQISTVSLPTIINISMADEELGKRSFYEALEMWKRNSDLSYSK